MYITRVRLSNIKGFSGERTVELSLTRPDGSHAGWTVLAGRNGSGKTTMLRAIALAVAGPEVARNLMLDFGNWVSSDSGSARAMVSIGTEPEDIWHLPDRYASRLAARGLVEIDLGLSWSIPPHLATSSQWPREVQPRMTGDRFQSNLHLDDEEARMSIRVGAASGPWYLNRRGWFCAAYGAFRRLPGAAAGRLGPARNPRLEDRMASLFHEDVPLTEGVGWLIEQHLRELEGEPGAAELKQTVLQVLSDGLLPDDHVLSRVDSDGLWVVSQGREFPLREMSDGYRTVSALVVDILRQMVAAYGSLPCAEDAEGRTVVTAPGVVMIDEVEAHLHIAWQKRIGSWLKARFPRVQFIVTTHSPYICQDADPGGLVRLPGPAEQMKPHVVAEDLWERVVYGSGDDAVVSELFGIETTFSDAARRLRGELVALEVKVMKGTADAAEIARYRELKDKLTSSAITRSREIGAGLLDRGAREE
ncbi:AAA family ATPase [Actinocorallia lasiicapitis]